MTEQVKSGTAIVEYSEIDGAIAGLQKKYANRVYDVTTAAGMSDAKIARREVKTARTSLEKIRKEIKAPALARCKDIDTEAKRISAALLDIERPIDDIIKAEEESKAKIKAAKEKAEAERVARHQERILEIQQYPVQAIGKSAAEIRIIIEDLDAEDLSNMEDFQDFAEPAKRKARDLLVQTLGNQEHAEAEAERLAKDAEAERLRLEKVNRDLEKERRANQEKIDAENAKTKAAQEEIAKKQKAEQERMDKEAAERRAQVEADARTARKLAEEQERREAVQQAVCATQAEALASILEICQDGVGDPVDLLNGIEIICLANLEVE